MSSAVMLVKTPVLRPDCLSSSMAAFSLINPASLAAVTACVVVFATVAFSLSLRSHRLGKSSVDPGGISTRILRAATA